MMIVSVDVIKDLKCAPNSAYNVLKFWLLYHSNVIEGSNFTKENLELLMFEQIVAGIHKLDDIYETVNSLELFDYVIETLDKPLSKEMLLTFHSIIKDKTKDQRRGLVGCWKKIPNQIFGSKVVLIEPKEVEYKIEKLLKWWEVLNKGLKEIIEFHVMFEHIHPYQDANGRIGRLIMLKQCIENQVDLLLIHEELSTNYKKGIEKAQIEKEYSKLQDVFKECEKKLEKELSFVQESITYMENIMKDKTEKIIEEVNATMRLEGMPLTEDDKEMLRKCLEGDNY
ncbi:Fic family protein [Amedibacillus sp. YH-ame6]